TKLWIEKIEKETQGRVKIKPFWAGALINPRQSALELAKGVADIGDFSGAYAPRGYEFEKTMRMIFWGVNDRYLARKVYLEVFAKYPQLEKEFTDGGIKVMAYSGIPPYHLFSAKKPIRKAADIKGMTIKGAGDLGKLATALGGEGINLPMSESYIALQKGTIDGLFSTYETLKTFKFAEVVKYVIIMDILPAPSGHWGYSLKSWNKLPKDIQKVFEDNIEWLGLKVEELVYGAEDAGSKLAKEHGVEFINLPPEELGKIHAVIERTILGQMAKLDAKGLPGTEVYREIRSLIKKYGK
ncbi:TRAP transporter substrate-binding protein DctP, partial [Thermodesulfobacteriota bacterium]